GICGDQRGGESGRKHELPRCLGVHHGSAVSNSGPVVWQRRSDRGSSGVYRKAQTCLAGSL
ncbi:uncharacterized protein METZ01_LOCUS235488, partial [marine metagenome]